MASSVIIDPGITVYPGKRLTAQDFALSMETLGVIKSGIIHGMTLSGTNTTTLKVGPGRVLIRGRLVEHTPANSAAYTELTLPASNGTFNLYLKADLDSGAATLYLTTNTEADENVTFNEDNTGVAYLLLGVIVAANSTISGITVTEDASVTVMRTVTIAASSWTDASTASPIGTLQGPWYKVMDSRVTVNTIQEILPPANVSKEMNRVIQLADIHDGGQAAGALYLVCYGVKPATDISLRVLFRGSR